MNMNSKTYKAKAGHLSLFLTIVYSDKIENILIKCGKTGSTINTAMTLLGVFLSKAIQRGYPVDRAIKHFSHIHSGSVLSNGQDLFDFIGRALEEVQTSLSSVKSVEKEEIEEKKQTVEQIVKEDAISSIINTEILCNICKKACIKSGSCYVCPNCGQTTGCAG